MADSHVVRWASMTLIQQTGRWMTLPIQCTEACGTVALLLEALDHVGEINQMAWRFVIGQIATTPVPHAEHTSRTLLYR